MSYIACLNNSGKIPVCLHKASTTARPFMHTPSTVRAYSYHLHYGNLHFLYHVLKYNHFNHALWDAVRCEASGASKAMPAVAEASKVTCILSNYIQKTIIQQGSINLLVLMLTNSILLALQFMIAIADMVSVAGELQGLCQVLAIRFSL